MQDIHEESLIRIHKDIQDKVTLFGSTQERNALLARAGQIAKPTDDTITMQFFNSPNNIDLLTMSIQLIILILLIILI